MTEKMTTLTTKVSPSEKLGFVELCTKEGVSPSVALQSLVVECIKRGAIKAVYRKQTATGEDKPHSKDEDKTGYMAMHGITPMKKQEP